MLIKPIIGQYILTISSCYALVGKISESGLLVICVEVNGSYGKIICIENIHGDHC